VGAGPNAGDGFHQCRFAVIHVARSTDINARLVTEFLDVPVW
jgi:hypothetical protein